MRDAIKQSHRALNAAVLAGVVLVIGGLLAAKPIMVRYELSRVRRAISDRNPKLAIGQLEAFKAKYGDHAEAEFLLARAFRHREAYKQVQTSLHRAMELGYPSQKLERERLLMRAESGQMALEDPDLQALVANPGSDAREIYEALVKGYFRLYELGPALLVLDVWQEAYPTDAQPLLYRGLLCEHKDEWERAAQFFQQAILLAPNRTALCKHLAHAEQKQHNYRRAVHYYRIALQQSEDVESLLGLGMCLKARGELEAARDTFQRGLAMEPEHFACLLALGELDVEAGKGADALHWLVPAAKLKPKEYDVQYGLAKALLFAGRGDEARQHFEFAATARQELSRVKALQQQVAANPRDAELRYEIGQGLAKYGDPQEAFKWLSSVLKYAPDHQLARLSLAELAQ